MESIIYGSKSTYFSKTLPKLIETVWNKGNRILIYSKNKNLLNEFDERLWTYEQLSFLPHVTENDELIEETPIVLTSLKENCNNANILINLDNTLPEFSKNFQKIIFMYNISNKEEQATINNLTTLLKENHFEIIHYVQEEAGAWRKLSGDVK